jgi:hypothetical protein
MASQAAYAGSDIFFSVFDALFQNINVSNEGPHHYDKIGLAGSDDGFSVGQVPNRADG